jgi:hypothetical protein
LAVALSLHSEVALTGAGRKAFLKYLDSMAGLLR